MTNKHVRRISTQIAAGSTEFGEITDKVNRLRELDKALKVYLPEELREHCQVINFHEDRQVWVVKAESAAWATRLNYVLPGLVSKLQMDNYDIKQIACRIFPDHEPAGPDARLPEFPERGTAQAISDFAEGVEDERLKAALLSLGKHLEG